MHDLPAKNQWTGTRTITAAGNRSCIITLRLSDFKSQTSLTLLLRHYELSNENVSYFLTHQSKTKMFIDLKVNRKAKPTRNSTRPYLNEIPVIGVNLFQFKLMRFHFKKLDNLVPSPLRNSQSKSDSFAETTRHSRPILQIETTPTETYAQPQNSQ